MTVDSKEVMHLMNGFIEVSLHLLTLVVACIFIYVKLGNSIWRGMLTLVISCLLNLILIYFFTLFVEKQLQCKDQRIALSTDVIDCIKSIKYLGWEGLFQAKIMQKRKMEFKMLAIYKLLDGVLVVFWNSISYILLCAFLIGFLSDGHKLGDTNIFSLIAIFDFIRYPLSIIPDRLKDIQTGIVSYRRLQIYLMSAEIDPEAREVQVASYDSTVAISLAKRYYKWPTAKPKLQNSQEAVTIKNESSALNDKLLGEEGEAKEAFTMRVKKLIIEKGTLTFIIGRVGSGKSALLNVILNEMTLVEDSQRQLSSSFGYDSMTQEERIRMNTITSDENRNIIYGQIAYVAQNPWVRKQTIKDNILFGQEMNNKLYTRSLDQCCLTSDLAEFKEKDLKNMGPEGKSVSGGQRQRVTLARALYFQPDIYIFDDVFSSLDVHVADNIFKKLILPLIKQKKTVIFVTSHYKYLDEVDANILLIKNGEIIDDDKQIDQYLEEEDEEDQEDIEEEEDVHSNNHHTKLVKQQSSDKAKAHVKIGQAEEEAEEDEEEREEGEINTQTLIQYFKSMTLSGVALYFVSLILVQGTRNLCDFWLKAQLTGDTYYDQINSWFDYSFINTFIFLIALSIISTIVNGLVYVFCTLISSWSTFKKLNKSILNSKMPFFDQNQQGRIINRLSNDTFAIDDEIPFNASIFMEFLLRSIGYPIAIIIILPYTALVVVILLFLSILLVRIFRKSNRELKRLHSVNEGQLLTQVSETINGVKTIRAFNKQGTALKDFLQKATIAATSEYNGSMCFDWIGVRMNLLANLLFLSVGLLIIILITFDISVTYSSLALAITYALLMNEQFFITLHFFSITERSIISVERINQYFLIEQEHQEAETSIRPSAVFPTIKSIMKKQILMNNILEPIRTLYQLELVNIRSSRVNTENTVEFHNVNMSYDGNNQALSNFSLSIKKGEKVAICGRTGSGKSSIINLLFRLYDHQEGSVYIDGICTTAMCLKELRSKISIVPQFGFLFNASVRENLDPDLSMSEQDLLAIFEKHELSIRNLSGKELLDFTIDQGGENLSNGEKQIINCVRVLLQSRDIICLDEATSNMDPKTDKKIHEILFEYSSNRTLIAITHRLENIDVYDRVVVMEQGKIVEMGHVSQLRLNQNGFFNKIAKQI